MYQLLGTGVYLKLWGHFVCWNLIKICSWIVVGTVVCLLFQIFVNMYIKFINIYNHLIIRNYNKNKLKLSD